MARLSKKLKQEWKIIEEVKTGMVLFYQSQNRQKNIQRPVPQMSE